MSEPAAVNRSRQAVALLAGLALALALGVASGARADAATSANRALVDAWYQEFLGRSAAGDAGSGYWVDQLDHRSRDAVLTELTRSEEYASRGVTRMYRSYLSRDPDPGARYWIDGVKSGAFPLEWVEQNVLASPEYVRRYAPTNGGSPRADREILVLAYFVDILKRPRFEASGDELHYFADEVIIKGYLATVRDIWYTEEAVQVRFNVNFERIFNRAYFRSEYDYWSGFQARSDDMFRIQLASTDEYAHVHFS